MKYNFFLFSNHDLVGDEYCSVELFGNLDEGGHHFTDHLLACGELSSSREVCPEEVGDAVNYEQAVVLLNHLGSALYYQFHLMFICISPRHQYVVKHLLRVELPPLCNLHYPLWPECRLCVDVDRFPVASSVLFGQLASDTESVTELGFPFYFGRMSQRGNFLEIGKKLTCTKLSKR